LWLQQDNEPFLFFPKIAMRNLSLTPVGSWQKMKKEVKNANIG
jgi:hypothetical protein